MKILLILFLTITLFYAKKTEVNWHITEFTPFININDNYKDGICISAMNTAIAKLQNYKHKVLITPFPRIMEEMKVLNLVCSPCILKNKDREKEISFSKSFMTINMQLGLIVKSKSLKKIKPFMSDENIIDLEKLLNSKIFKLGVASGYSYGSKIDSIIKKHNGKKNLYKRSGINISEGFIQMMIVDRDIDGTIIYKSKLDDLLNKYKKELKKDFVFLKIKELSLFNHLYIACSKTKEGQIFIDNLNNHILDIRNSVSKDTF